MKQRLATPLILLSLLAACNFPETATPTPASQAPPQASGSTQKKCGDGVCDGPENPNNCPQDCDPTSTHAQEPTTAPELPEIGQGLMQELRVTNPSSGSQLYVLVVNAQDWDGSPLPTIVIVPGGLGEGSSYAGEKRTAQKIAGEGYTVVVFDPDGRGNSEGTEDKNGHIQQDGLAAVVEAITTNPRVDPDRIGMLSYSFGITMASGALARHPDLPVRFLIDWEGPANREDTTHGCQP